MPAKKSPSSQYWIVSEAELSELKQKGFTLTTNHSYRKNGVTYFVFPERRKTRYSEIAGMHVILPLDVYAMMKPKPVVGFMQTFSGGKPATPKVALLRNRRKKQIGKVSSVRRRRSR